MKIIALLSIAGMAACSKQSNETMPAAPQGLTAQIEGKNVRLSWQPPEESSIKEYSLSYLPDGVPRTIPKDSSTVIVKYLQHGDTYAFSLRARDFHNNLSDAATVRIAVTDGSGSGQDTTGIPDDTMTYAYALFTGDITLTTQAEVEAFAKAYTRVEGKLAISGADISSLLPLSSLDTVKDLEIYSNPSLATLKGLHNLKCITRTLYIRENNQLMHIDELGRLTAIGKDLTLLDNKSLAHLNGLSGLALVEGTVYIGVEAWKIPPKARGNNHLSDFCGLKTLLSGNGLKGGWFVENNASNPTQEDIVNNCN